jgi:hypothetical protein
MALRLILLLAVAVCGATAQQRTVSSSTRPGVNDNASGALEGTRPEKVLKVVKDKGQVTSIDLQNRTVLFSLNKTKSIKLAFSQPAGREQIKAGKKATKRIGKNRLRLEELETGAKVRVQYYPLLSQLLEVVID